MSLEVDFSSLRATSHIPAAKFAEHCRDDLERRWRSGERITVETYFEQFPSLSEEIENALLMIYSEFLLREQLGEQPSPREFLDRFPKHAEMLRIQLQLHSALGSESDVDASVDEYLTESSVHMGITADRDLELFEEIGRGGMGIIHRGHDHVLNRELAVKVLRPGQFERQFFSEARIGGRLQHPGIVPVHRLGRLADGRPYFTMKLVEGSNLAELFAKRPHPLHQQQDFLRIFEKVCQTVAYAHERGVIHRDLKPANVMVGPFGDVQVMDWGLSKLVGTEEEPAVISNAGSLETSPSQSTANKYGSIIGTLGYMAPEQIGSTNEPDARSDVFGLGGILCELLTGQPPFLGTDRATLLEQTARGELADAKLRLDRCSADAELIALAKSCLDADRRNRPANAGVVAKAVADSFTNTDKRLRNAELASATAKARSLADQRARRLTTLMSAVGVAVAVMLAFAAFWFLRDRDQRMAEQNHKRATVEQAVRIELQKAIDLEQNAHELVSDPPRWEAALASAKDAAERASRLIETEGVSIDTSLQDKVTSIIETIREDEEDRQLITRLEAIRLVPEGFYNKSTSVDRFQAVPKYRSAFAARGLNVPHMSMEEATAWLSKRPRPIRTAITAMLDDWLAYYPYEERNPTANWLRDFLQAVETDPWMREIRDVRYRPNLALLELRRLADQADMTIHPPSAYYLLATDLSNAGDTKKAKSFLERAQLHHPDDFWLNFILGQLHSNQKENSEALQFFQAARVARPHDPRLLSNLGQELRRVNDLDGAEIVFQQALKIDPNTVYAHVGLGMLKRAKNDWDGAIDHFCLAISLDPSNPNRYHEMADALLMKSDFENAIQYCQRSLELAPDKHAVYSTLGNALARQKDWIGAVAARQRAVELNPHSSQYLNALGLAFRERNDWEKAGESFRRATELDPANSDYLYNLGQALFTQKKWSDAANVFRNLISRNPNHSLAHANLGVCLRNLKDLNGSLASLNRANDINGHSSWIHSQLGHTYRELNDLNRAVDSFQRALEQDSNDYVTRFTLGIVFLRIGQFKNAEATFRKCLEMSPNDPQAHCNLGIALRDQGRFAEGVEYLRSGHVLSRKDKNWKYASEKWLKDCEELVRLDNELPMASNANATDQFAMANLCAKYRRNNIEAAQLSKEALSKDPTTGDGRRIQAARWAALAAGSVKSEAEKLAYAKLSREWLLAEINAPQSIQKLTIAWKSILTAIEFAEYREEALLYRLPENERTAWRQFWDDLRIKLSIHSSEASIR